MNNMLYVASRDTTGIYDVLQDAKEMRQRVPKGVYSFKIRSADLYTDERDGAMIKYVSFGFELNSKVYECSDYYDFTFELSPDLDSPYQLFLQRALDVLPVNMIDWAGLIGAEGHLIIDHLRAGYYDYPYVKEFVDMKLYKNTYVSQLNNLWKTVEALPENACYRELVQEAFGLVDCFFSDYWIEDEVVACDD